MTTHTRTDIEATVEYECALSDCGHEESCPTAVYDCCQECSDRNWEESEGGVVMWDECGGTGMLFADADAESTEPVHWVGDAPTSLHGNGAASFDQTTRDAAEVTCSLCLTLLGRGSSVQEPEHTEEDL